MAKMWLVARYEYTRHVARRSFAFGLLSLPLIVALLIGIGTLSGALQGEEPAVVGYVDRAALLTLPEALSGEGETETSVRWVPFQEEGAAQAALEVGEIQAYYVLPPGYAETRQVELVYIQEPDREVVRQFEDLLRVNLLAGQPNAVARRVLQGSDLLVRLPGAGPGSTREFSAGPTLGQLLPVLVGFALILLTFVSSGYLMEAVADEKVNRTMEILWTSVSPGQLLSGKVLGITGIAFSYLAAWAGLTALLVAIGGNVLGLEWLRDLRVDPAALAVALLTLVLSYVLVAALMAALGAISAETHAAQQVTAVLISFYIMPMAFIPGIMQNLNGPFAIGASLLPLTAPVALPLRIAFAQVPVLQIAASVAIQGLCALGALWLAARALRLGMLRYGQRLRLGELFGGARSSSLAYERRAPKRAGVRRGSGPHALSRSKVLLILRHDLLTTATKPLFVLTCVGIPLILFLQLAAFDALRPGSGPASGAPIGVDAPAYGPGILATPEGYVDGSGLIRAIPDGVPEGALLAYDDEVHARQALDAGEILAYYVIPADYMDRGTLVGVRQEYNPLSPNAPSRTMQWTLVVNVLGGDEVLAARVSEPIKLQQRAWSPASRPGDEEGPRTEESSGLARLIPMLIMLLLYGVIVMASGLLLSSVSNEKKDRVIEMLLLSIHPRQMLIGKTIAQGIAGLLQAAVWGGMGLGFYALRGNTLRLPPGVELPPSLLAWGLLFFVLGYALYASLLAGAGALLPDIKASPMVSLIFYAPAFVGFEIGLFTVDNPHGALATASSLFPLTAPFTMMNRLAIGGVPPWQPVLAAALMLATIPFVVRAVAGMFHAQNLLSGQPFSIKRYYRALLGNG